MAKCQKESLSRITDLAVNGPDGRMLIRQAQAIGREADLWYHAHLNRWPTRPTDWTGEHRRAAEEFLKSFIRPDGTPQPVPHRGGRRDDTPPPARPVVPAGAEGDASDSPGDSPMQVTITIHPSVARDNPAETAPATGGLTAIARELEAPTSADDRDPRGEDGGEPNLPGRAGPGPAVEPAGPGRRLGAADRRADGRGRADGRSAAPGLEQQAGPRRQGPDPQLRQEERPAVEDRRLEPAAGRGGVPVRPGAIDPIILPTPRADAFRAGLPACRGHWTRRQLVAWRRIVLEEILGQNPRQPACLTARPARPIRAGRAFCIVRYTRVTGLEAWPERLTG